MTLYPISNNQMQRIEKRGRMMFQPSLHSQTIIITTHRRGTAQCRQNKAGSRSRPSFAHRLQLSLPTTNTQVPTITLMGGMRTRLSHNPAQVLFQTCEEAINNEIRTRLFTNQTKFYPKDIKQALGTAHLPPDSRGGIYPLPTYLYPNHSNGQ